MHQKKARVPQPKVLAVRTPSLGEKEMLLALDPVRFFTEPHYDGHPAVFVRLEAISADDLAEVITMGWRCLTARARRCFDAQGGVPATKKARQVTKSRAKKVARGKTTPRQSKSSTDRQGRGRSRRLP